MICHTARRMFGMGNKFPLAGLTFHGDPRERAGQCQSAKALFSKPALRRKTKGQEPLTSVYRSYTVGSMTFSLFDLSIELFSQSVSMNFLSVMIERFDKFYMNNNKKGNKKKN